MLRFCREKKMAKLEPSIDFRTKLANLKRMLTEPQPDEDELWTANAQKAHDLLTDTAE